MKSITKKLLLVGALLTLAAAPQELRDEAARLEQTQAMLVEAADQIDALKAEKAALETQLADSEAAVAARDATIAELEARIAELEAGQEPPPSGCDGVQVAAGSDLSAVVADHGPGTRYCLAAGAFTVTSSVQAQEGDVFIGAGREATFVEGDGVTQHLFVSSNGASFEVRALDISGAVGDLACAPNCGRAFRATGIVTLVDIRCHDNMNQCAGGGGGGVVMLDSECDHNGVAPFNTNPDGPGNTRSAACIKKASSGMQRVEVRGSHIHDNGWVGVWCDFCAPDSVFIVEDSVITDNASKGVSYEVSGGWSANDFGVVRNNVIQRNGLLDARTVSAGVTANSSADLLVEGNDFGGNANGRAVGLIDAKRGGFPMENIVIRGNDLAGDTIKGCDITGVTCLDNAA